MKSILRRITALALCAVLLCSTALASDALGGKIYGYTLDICDDTTLTREVMWSSSRSDLRTENYVTYKPSDSISPVVSFGSSIPDKQTVTSMAKALEKNGRRVLSGINGDYFVMATGDPLGIVITDGVLRSSASYLHAIGFNADGSAVIGTPNLSLMADFKGQSLKIADINKIRTNTGFYLFTDDFGNTTKNTQKGVDVILAPNTPGDQLKIGGTVSCTVEQVIEAPSGATAIPDGKFIMSISNKSGEWLQETIRSLQVGDTVDINISSEDTRWNNVQHAVGAMYWILKDGKVDTSISDGASAPRTAVGVKPDGSVVFYTIDGRRSGHSIGASLSQVAQRMIELGCVAAIGLDGGGSTTITVTQPDDTTAATINRPSDGSERAVANHLFLVATNEPTGELGHFYVQADNAYVLAGSKVEISAAAVDTNYIPMDEDYDYDLEASDGELDGNILTTPKRGGEITVTASSGRREGSTTVYAIEDPTDVVIRDSSGTALTTLNAATGTTTQLAATAAYNHISLKADPEAFTWEVTGDIGTVDEHGLFTAAAPGTGTITVSAGRARVSIPVTVSSSGTVSAGGVMEVESFEGSTTIFRGSGSNMDFSLNHSADTVRMGSGSAKVDYTLTETGASQGAYTAEWRASKSTGIDCSTYTALHLWVYGDGSGNILSLLYNDCAAGYQSLQVTPLDFTGWKQVTVTLPGAHFEIQGLQVSATTAADGTVSVGDKLSGTIYIDHITATASGTPDNAAPVVSASLDNSLWQVTASVADAVDGILPAGSVTVTYNGAPYGSYDPATGLVTVALPGPGESHEAMRITITARDLSGNIGRASVDVEPYGVDHKFTDINDYWAATYVDFLYNANITTGYADGTFRPNDNISRQQFAVMLYRYLGLDGTQYESVTLPFADNASIGDYALTAVKALYTEGIINGSTGSDGRLYFNPGGSLTRAQAAAMIGRTQEKGYAIVDLTFSDTASIPAYATYYIQTMAAQGVISGYADGTFQPGANITRGQMAKILYNLM